MSKTLTLEVPDEAYEALVRLADKDGVSPEAAAQQWLQKQLVDMHPETMGSPSSVTDPIEFMKLPLEERRRILAEQAEKLVSHYETDTEWREWLAGDFVDY